MAQQPRQSKGLGTTQVEVAAQRLYARVLSQWALDLMMLRRDGLDEPSARGGAGVVTPPAWEGAFVGHGEQMRWVGGALERELRWKPAARKAA
jgi:hypothetical protein